MISFVCDIEGDWDFACKLFRESKVVTLVDDELEFIDEDGMFVFGGDLFDRGPGDIRLSKLLCSFHDRHPGRVVLLLGNRDINKLRFASEMNLDVAPENAYSAWWDPKAPTLQQYLEEKMVDDSVIERCKWMLRHTLGCPKTFEFRREELSLLGRPSSDNDVAQSFVDGVVNDDGFYMEYLKRGKLAFRCGNTLFVHGATDSRGLGFIPSLSIEFKQNSLEEVTGTFEANLDAWIEQLNEFAQNSLVHFQQQKRWSADGKRGGDALMAYQNKPAMHNRTVCVHSYVDGKNMPEQEAWDAKNSQHRLGHNLRVNPLDEAALKHLGGGGISRVCVGHTPSGNSAAILKDEKMEIISADTNYAAPDGGRGDSWAEVLVEKAGGSARVQGSCGGRRYDFAVEAPIGTRVEHEGQLWWVKVRFDSDDDDSSEFLISRGRGRVCEDAIIKL